VPSKERAFVELSNGSTHLLPHELPALVARCAAMLGGRDALLLLVDIEQRSLHPFGPEAAASHPVDEAGPGAGQAYRTEDRVRVEIPDGKGEARLWLPLLDSAERLGVFGVVVGPDDGDPELWAAFASAIGEFLVSKAKYGDSITRLRRTRPLSLAAEMRWSQLPPLTFTSPAVEISGVLEPAYEIAGDTFDYAVNGDALSLAVLDAMGHGLEASRMANLAVGEYRRGRRNDQTLGELVTGVDHIIATVFGDSRFVTGQFATLDLPTGHLRIINAGHPRPLLFREAGDVSEVECRPCPPLGLGLVSTEETRLDLRPGDVVLFHTDGITEARSSDGEQFGRDRLVAVVASALRQRDRPAEVLRQVVHAVSDHSDESFQDDATAVFLRWPHRASTSGADGGADGGKTAA
jgi:serine/threonine protein phosphatase PrpC